MRISTLESNQQDGITNLRGLVHDFLQDLTTGGLFRVIGNTIVRPSQGRSLLLFLLFVGDKGQDGPRRGGIHHSFHGQGMSRSGLTRHVLFQPGRGSNSHGGIVIAIIAASGQGLPLIGTLGIGETKVGAVHRSTHGQVQTRLGILSTAMRFMGTLNDTVQQDTRQMTEGILEG